MTLVLSFCHLLFVTAPIVASNALYIHKQYFTCNKRNSCSNQTLILAENGTIYGGGYQSMSGINTQIISEKNNSDINCDGAQSCKYSQMLSLSQTFDNDGSIYKGINCHGFQSCQKSNTESKTLIACLGDKSCQDSIVAAKYFISCGKKIKF